MKTVTARDLVVGEGAKDHCVANGKTITDVKSEALPPTVAGFRYSGVAR